MSSLKLFRRRPEDAPQIVARDARRVRHHAAAVLEVLPDGIRERMNPNPSLNVLAVIGPGQAQGMRFPSAVLLEVGLGRAIPYHDSRGLGSYAWLPERHPLCALERGWYARLSSRIFGVLQRVTDERVKKWKTGPHNPFFLQTNHVRYHQRGGLIEEKKLRMIQRGTYFSIAKRDVHLLADAYWLQLNDRERHRRLVGLIDKMFNEYRSIRGYLNGKYAQWVRAELRARCPENGRRGSWPPYLFVEMLRHLRGGKRNPHYSPLETIVSEVTGWDGGLTPEQQLARAACPNPHLRLDGISIRDISGLRLQDAAKDHVVFEMLPSGERKEQHIA